MLDSARSRKIYTLHVTYMRFWNIVKIIYCSQMFVHKLHKYWFSYSAFNSVASPKENCAVVNILKNWQMIFFSRNRKQIVFKRFSFFILLRSTIVIIILSRCFQCSNFQAHRKSLYFIMVYIVLTHTHTHTRYAHKHTFPITFKWISFWRRDSELSFFPWHFFETISFSFLRFSIDLVGFAAKRRGSI